MDARAIERQAADALLDAGISLPLFHLRIPFFGTKSVRITMRRPYLGTHMRIARIWLGLGVSAADMEEMTDQQEMEFMTAHGKALSQMLALTVCRGWLSGLLLAPIVAWLIRWRVDRHYQIEAQLRFMAMRSSRDFTPIIGWAETTNPFRAAPSQRNVPERVTVKRGS